MKKISRGRKASTTDESMFLWFSDRREEATKLNPDIFWDVHLCVSSSQPEKAAWKRTCARVLAEWIKNRPGTRPSYWWAYSAPRAPLGTFPGRVYDGDKRLPDPRRQVAGAGKPNYSCFPSFGFGVPLDWEGFDKRKPPVFENEASYLKRHGLLTADEEKRANFAPVTVTDLGIFNLDNEIIE